MRVGVLLVGLLIGALAVWLAITLGASFGVQVLVLIAATYAGTWIATLAGIWLLRHWRHAGHGSSWKDRIPSGRRRVR